MKKTYKYGILIFIILVAFYAPLFFLGPEQADNLTREDGIVQNCSAICWLLSSIVSFYLFFKSGSIKEKYFLKAKRNYFFMLLGLFFLFCCGEEISWGQRIFNVGTPEFLVGENLQNEINIHNLKYFHGADINGNIKTGWELLLTSTVIFSLFWLFFCLFIPTFSKYSLKVRRFLKNINFPVVPLWIGLNFLFNYLIAKSIQKINFIDYLNSMNGQVLTEIKENNFSVLFLLVSISFYFIYLKNNKVIAE